MSTTGVSTLHSIGRVLRIAAVKIVHLLTVLSLLAASVPRPSIVAHASGIESSTQESTLPQSSETSPQKSSLLTFFEGLKISTHRNASSGAATPSFLFQSLNLKRQNQANLSQPVSPVPEQDRIPDLLVPTGAAIISRADTLPGQNSQLLNSQLESIDRINANLSLDQIPLQNGWNLISLPKTPPNTDPAAVLSSIAGDITKVYAYDGCDSSDPWKVYDPAADPASNDLSAIDPTIGMWIQTNQAATLPVAGSLPSTTTIQLCKGWNLIGIPLGQARDVRSVLSSIEGKYTRVFGYDPTDQDDPWEVYDVAAPEWANDLNMMLPGRGYWILATEDTTLTLANQGAAPFVEIVSPKSTATEIPTVTYLTDVIGTVRSDLLQSWTLSYRSYDDNTFVPFASGVIPLDNAALGSFDPTLLLNGTYQIQLTATDYANQSMSASVDVTVEGQAKVGNFTVSFIDLEVPVAGMPIQVIRTYDSRDKRVGDFGVGWTLSLTDMRLQENGTPGMGWQGTVIPGPILSYCIQPTPDHIVTITLPDGKIYKFRAAVAPQCQAVAPQQVVNVNYVPLPGTNATLTQLDFTNSAVVIGNFPGSLQLFDQNTFNLYDPNRYQLTLQDGRKFVVSQKDGLQTITDLNGNVLTFNQYGISHSAGKSVTFTRDAQGRITTIKDPAGNSLTYTYDSATGDLTVFTDRENNKTTFTYNTAHYLLDIHDALGRQPIRNEYDASGRLLSHTDAFGKKILYTHDLNARQEMITDRLGQVRLLEYDVRGNVIRETDPEGNVIVRTFDSLDNRLSETEPHDPAVTKPPTTFFTYDARDNLLTTTDPMNNVTVYTYNTRDQVLTVKDPKQNITTTNTYDAKGNLTETTNPDGVTKYTYDARGNVLTITDALNGVTKFEYDASGNLTKEIDALGHETVYTYDANGDRLTQTRTRTTPSGVETLVTKFTYDHQGRLTETKDPDNTTTKVIYNKLGQQSATVDKLGRTTQFEYDDLGRLVKTIYPDSTTEEMTYDAEGRRLTFKDRADRITNYTYDTLGRLIQTTFPDDSFTLNAYDAAGRLISTTDGRGKKTIYEYDAAGRRTKVTDPLHKETTFGYDPNGNQVSFTDPNGQITRYEYDALNRRIKTIFPDNIFSTTKYDSLGRRIEETDRAGKITHFDYDALGQLIEVEDALEQKSTYTYDEVGNFITQTDANGHTTRFEYDALGRQTKRTLPDGNFESMSYDAAGNLTTHTDFNGFKITYQYEQFNDRLARRQYPDGSQVSFTYTATGQRLSVTDARGTTQYTYNLRDQLESLTDPDDHKLEYTYDKNGDRTSLTATIGTAVLTTTYFYDDASRLDKVTDPQNRVYDDGYDANGNRTSLTYPNGTATDYKYDTLNRLTELTTTGPGGTIQSYKFTLGPAGNRVKIEEQDGTAREYSYDDLYRLTGEKVSNVSGLVYEKSFTYDPVGNRLEQETTSSGPSGIDYSYDERDRLLTEGSTTYTWDDHGNLITKSGEASYTWDYENHLTRVEKIDGTVIAYAYDADGNRVQTTTTLAGVTTVTNYLVDISGPLSQVVAETDANSNLIAYYVRGDDLLAMIRGSQTRFYHADGLGSIRRLTDESGTVTDTYTYTAFGELLNHTGTDPQPYAFAGEPFDSNIGFYYNRARWMDPIVGRFTGMDPWVGDIFDPQSLHRYLYSNANPVNNRDPSGNQSLSELAVVAAVVGLLNAAFNGLTTAISGGTRSQVALAEAKGFLIGAGIGAAVYLVLWGGMIAYVGLATGGATFSPQIYNAFRSGHAYVVSLERTVTVYRYTAYPPATSSVLSGQWWTTTLYPTSSQAIQELALPANNTAQYVYSGVIPAGTQVVIGEVAPMFGNIGGGIQIFTSDPLVMAYLGRIQ
ncbi:MAG TPA: RHS repeat-associated core domain-containing protein [Anaerolineales bacterium]|nr:RHS repeat-associated core domain-containing protein [Anaerolineales bacterium]